jgi:hypothetical protein
MNIFLYLEINVSKLVLQKSFARNTYSKFQKFYCAKIVHTKLTIFLRALLNQFRETFGFMVFSPFLILVHKSELPKSGDYAILGLFFHP